MLKKSMWIPMIDVGNSLNYPPGTCNTKNIHNEYIKNEEKQKRKQNKKLQKSDSQ